MHAASVVLISERSYRTSAVSFARARARRGSGQADRDGNPWIVGKAGYAPAGGWPSYVNLG